MIALLVVLVFASSLLIDYAHARYAFARDEGCALVSSCWSAIQWGRERGRFRRRREGLALVHAARSVRTLRR